MYEETYFKDHSRFIPDCTAICLTISSFKALSGIAGAGITGDCTTPTAAVETGADGWIGWDCGLFGTKMGVLKASCNKQKIFLNKLFSFHYINNKLKCKVYLCLLRGGVRNVDFFIGYTKT